jgi:hypothetical protein
VGVGVGVSSGGGGGGSSVVRGRPAKARGAESLEKRDSKVE